MLRTVLDSSTTARRKGVARRKGAGAEEDAPHPVKAIEEAVQEGHRLKT